MKHLLTQAGRQSLRERLKQAPLLGFDFDGTLAPIVDNPARAEMRTHTRALLHEVASRFCCVVLSAQYLQRVQDVAPLDLLQRDQLRGVWTGEDELRRSVIPNFLGQIADVQSAAQLPKSQPAKKRDELCRAINGQAREGGTVAATYEIYGRLSGRQVPLWKELSFDGVAFHIKQGGRIPISHSSSAGYGFGGVPGRWTQLNGSRSPSDWGLDSDKGVVAFDEARAYAVPATQLVEIFGSGWRQVVYA